MKKILIVFGTIIVLALALYFGWMFMQDAPLPPDGNGQIPTTTFPDGGSIQTVDSTGATLSVRTENGSILTVQNFISDTETFADPINPGYYYLGYHSSPTHEQTTEPPYIIEYISMTQYFNVSLLREPISLSRGAAEQYLMNVLGVTKEEMCTLSYTVSTPIKVNEKYAGMDLRFSFCPGSVELK